MCSVVYVYGYVYICAYIGYMYLYTTMWIFSILSSLNTLSILIHWFCGLGNWSIRTISMGFLKFWCPGGWRRTSVNYQRPTTRKWSKYLFWVSLWNTMMGNPQLKIIVSTTLLLHVPVSTFPFSLQQWWHPAVTVF